VLYALAAGGQYNEQEEAAILAATREGHVDQDTAWAICEKLAPPDDGDADDGGEDGDEDRHDSSDEKDAEKILDGPPPEVPPTPPNPPPTDFALRDFDQAISALNRLKTKPSAQFAKTTHSADDLESVEAFIHAVMRANGPSGVVPPRREHSADEVERKLARLAELENKTRTQEITIEGLRRAIAELQKTSGDPMSVSEFQTAHKKWEDTVETQKNIIRDLQNENAALRAEREAAR